MAETAQHTARFRTYPIFSGDSIYIFVNGVIDIDEHTEALIRFILAATAYATSVTRLMAFAPSLALDPTFRIHAHKTLDTAQPCHLLKPN